MDHCIPRGVQCGEQLGNLDDAIRVYMWTEPEEVFDVVHVVAVPGKAIFDDPAICEVLESVLGAAAKWTFLGEIVVLQVGHPPMSDPAVKKGAQIHCCNNWLCSLLELL